MKGNLVEKCFLEIFSLEDKDCKSINLALIFYIYMYI